MADRYNSTTGGNWNSTASWATTDGGAGPASFPVAGDRVFITGNGGNIAVNVSSACGDLTKTGATLSGSAALALGGSASFAGTITYTGAITFNATATGKTITSNGKTLGSNITFNGVGGGWTLTDAFTTSGTATLTNGTFSDGGSNVTASTLASNNSNARTLTLTANTALTGTGTVLNLATTTNLTFTAGPSHRFTVSSTGSTAITVSVAATTFNDLYFTGGTYSLSAGSNASTTWRNVDFTGFKGTLTTMTCNVTGNYTCDSGMTNGPANNAIIFTGNGSPQLLTTNGSLFQRGARVDNGAYLKLADALDQGASVSQGLQVLQGTFDANNKNVRALLFSSGTTNGVTRSVLAGSGTLTLYGTGTVLQHAFATGLTLDYTAATVRITDTSATSKLVNFGVGAYGALSVVGGVGSGAVVLQPVTGGTNTIGTLTVENPGSTISLPSVAAITVNAVVGLSGNASNHNALVSSNPGQQAMLVYGGAGVVSADYVDAQDITGLPGYSWFMGDHSTNLGNNLGVAFCSPANASMMALAA